MELSKLKVPSSNQGISKKHFRTAQPLSLPLLRTLSAAFGAEIVHIY